MARSRRAWWGRDPAADEVRDRHGDVDEGAFENEGEKGGVGGPRRARGHVPGVEARAVATSPSVPNRPGGTSRPPKPTESQRRPAPAVALFLAPIPQQRTLVRIHRTVQRYS